MALREQPKRSMASSGYQQKNLRSPACSFDCHAFAKAIAEEEGVDPIL
jgi:hypothetical protein